MVTFLREEDTPNFTTLTRVEELPAPASAAAVKIDLDVFGYER